MREKREKRPIARRSGNRYATTASGEPPLQYSTVLGATLRTSAGHAEKLSRGGMGNYREAGALYCENGQEA